VPTGPASPWRSVAALTAQTAMLRWLAELTCAGMLLVLVMGAAVTNTGSSEGCGRSWPLCNGQFVPEFTVATAIEYSHRAVTGFESLLVLGLAAAMLVLWRQSREVIALAALMLGTLLLQAALGAGAVLWPQSPLVLATHFGVSLIAVASTFLSAAVVFERTSAQRMGLKTSEFPDVRTGHVPGWQTSPVAGVRTGHVAGWETSPVAEVRISNLPELRSMPRGGGLTLPLAITVYILCVVYLGAYVRHADLSLACLDWPLCNGQVIPPLDSATGVVFAHRLAALGAVLLLGLLAMRVRTSASLWAFALGILQALSGALIVFTRLGLFSTLLHAALMGVLFALVAYVVRQSRTRARREASAADKLPLSTAAARAWLRQ
jgi:cytochrome c oxidase assembly protein subunit 15